MAGNLDALNKLYQETVGRDVDTGGFDYWNKQLNQGTSSIDKIRTQLMGSKEYTDRASAVANAGDAGIAESELDKLDSAYKGSYASMKDQHQAAALASISKGADVHAGNVATYSDMFNEDGSQKDTWKGIDDWNLNKIKGLQDEITTLKGDSSSSTTDTTAAAASGLTLDDLNSWWDTKQSKTDKFDQFKEFMGLMGGMGGMFGGGGVPGFASGGVAAASPYNNFMGFMNAFKSLGSGSNKEDISTGNIN